MSNEEFPLMNRRLFRPSEMIDWNCLQKADSGLWTEGVKTNHLRRKQEENFSSNSSSLRCYAVELSKVQFETPQDQLLTNQCFEMSCQVLIHEQTTDQRIEFRLMCAYVDDSGQEEEEELGCQCFEGFLPSEQKPHEIYQIRVQGKLHCPAVSVGTDLTYWLVACHSAAPQSVVSSKVRVRHQWQTHQVRIQNHLFHHGGCIPCLDEQGFLLKNLASVLIYARDEAPLLKCDRKGIKPREELVVFGHAASAEEGEHSHALSLRRTQFVQSLLTQNQNVWFEMAVQWGHAQDIQRVLKSLTQCYGWDCDPGEVDDIWGPQTMSAIKAFQKQTNDLYGLHLAIDGRMGPVTWGALHRVLCGFLARTMGVVDPASDEYPRWEKPVFGFSSGQGCYACGSRFSRDSTTVTGWVDLMFIPCGGLELSSLDESSSADECVVYRQNLVRHIPVESFWLHVHLSCRTKAMGLLKLLWQNGEMRDTHLDPLGLVLLKTNPLKECFLTHADGVVEDFKIDAMQGNRSKSLIFYSQRFYNDYYIRPFSVYKYQNSAAQVNDHEASTIKKDSWDLDYVFGALPVLKSVEKKQETLVSSFSSEIRHQVKNRVHLKMMTYTGLARAHERFELGCWRDNRDTISVMTDQNGMVDVVMQWQGPYFVRHVQTHYTELVECQGNDEPCWVAF